MKALQVVRSAVVLLIAFGLASGSTRAQAPAGEAFPPVDQLPVVKELPDPFQFADGSRVKSKEDWARRRAELEAMILHYQYGRLPPAPGNTRAVELGSGGYRAMKDVTHKTFKVTCGPEHKVSFVLDLLVPKGKGPFPVILRGDAGWGMLRDEVAAEVVGRGYVLAQFNRTELAPDNKGYKETGVYAAYPDADCGAVAAWAWGFHRCVDALLTLDYVAKDKIAVTGHSRGGKAALLAGATDPRVAITAPNNSGCGGAGSYKFQAAKSEDIAAITKNFPFWFGPRFTSFVGKIERLPIDQHEVKALCAPRALLTTEALGDLWANPEGSRQTHLAAKEVYKFLGAPDKIAIAYREGKHEHNADDWRVLLDFADEQFAGRKSGRDWDANPFKGEAATAKAYGWQAPAGE
jgi:dienelactone hydrolase